MNESLHAEINSQPLNVNLFELHPSGGGAGTWNELAGKPFNTIGANLKVVGGALIVDTAQSVEQDNTKPITSAAVYTEVGNINALLSTI